MENQVLQALHQSKLMLMYAQKQDWDAFINLYPQWEVDVQRGFIDQQPVVDVDESAEILKELIGDIDHIQALIKQRMSEIECQVSAVFQQKKALDSYLEQP